MRIRIRSTKVKMKILGIEFAPLNVPLQRRLQTLAAAAWFVTLAFGGFIGSLFSLYLLFTRFWWLSSLYLIWIYLDRQTHERGGRPVEWVQKWSWWYYLKQYFPAHLTFSSNFTLDSERNYLFCCFPHGILPAGPFANIQSFYSEFYQKYPNFKAHLVVLTQQFYMPIIRELAYSVGCISSSAEAINFVLDKPEGGNIALLMPGGAVEAYNSRPGQYKFVVKKRKGFVRLALKNGSPLVPVISFGESDLFKQIEGPKLRRVQECIRKILGLAPVVFSGRGFFQYSFGVIPRRKPIATVVGRPIEVPKVKNPTKEQVEELHETFLQELCKLFEEYKYKYLENPADKHLELE